MSSARPPSGIGSSAFLSSLSAANSLNRPKESTSAGCDLRRSFIHVVRAVTSATAHCAKRGSYPETPMLLCVVTLSRTFTAQPVTLQCGISPGAPTAKMVVASYREAREPSRDLRSPNRGKQPYRPGSRDSLATTATRESGGTKTVAGDRGYPVDRQSAPATNLTVGELILTQTVIVCVSQVMDSIERFDVASDGYFFR